MSLQRFSRRAVIGAVTNIPWTTNFRHLLPIPKKWLKRLSQRDPAIKSVRSKDRIKYWNIVPGDQIRVLGEKSNSLHEVLSINRISNRVFVKGAVNSKAGETDRVRSNKNYHYSRCQLFLGNFQFEKGSRPVFALRTGMSSIRWNPFFHRFEWKRFAVKTVPALPDSSRIPIPWPTPPPKKLPDPTQFDTTIDEVAKVTYVPPKFPLITQAGPIPRPPTEAKFLRAMYNPHYGKENAYSQHPVEGFLFRELSNPHSRAKKLKRWRVHQFLQNQLLKNIMAEALANKGSRDEREVIAEAKFQWRQQLEDIRKAVMKRRWTHKAAEAEMQRKNSRTARKELKQRQRLTELSLKDEPNQFIPKAV